MGNEEEVGDIGEVGLQARDTAPPSFDIVFSFLFSHNASIRQSSAPTSPILIIPLSYRSILTFYSSKAASRALGKYAHNSSSGSSPSPFPCLFNSLHLRFTRTRWSSSLSPLNPTTQPIAELKLPSNTLPRRPSNIWKTKAATMHHTLKPNQFS